MTITIPGSEATAMTDCNPKPLTFSSLGAKHVVADFFGGRLTTDAGALLLREADKATGLFEALDAAIPDPRDPDRITHDQRSMLAQRVLAIALGYEDLNDHQTLRDDPALQVAAGASPAADTPLASPPTLCRLENRVDRAALVRISTALVEQFIASHAAPPEHLILDFDATDDPVHGHQEGRFFHGYYDNYCFLPLYVFCGDELLMAYLRPSKIDAAKHSRAMLKLLVRRLRQAWPDVRITIRADSGFCRWRLMRWCDSHGVGYVLGLARNPALERLAVDWTGEAARRFKQTAQPQRVFGSFAYAAASWDRQRRVIVKARAHRAGAEPAVRGHQPPGRSAGAVRGGVLPARRDGEPDQGAATGPVRRPDQLPRLPGQPVPSAAEFGGLRAGRDAAADGAARDGPGAGAGRDDPAEAVQGGGEGGGLSPPGGVPPGQ